MATVAPAANASEIPSSIFQRPIGPSIVGARTLRRCRAHLHGGQPSRNVSDRTPGNATRSFGRDLAFDPGLGYSAEIGRTACDVLLIPKVEGSIPSRPIESPAGLSLFSGPAASAQRAASCSHAPQA